MQLAGLATQLDPTWVAMGVGRMRILSHEVSILEAVSDFGRMGPPTPNHLQDSS
jgi:hypothetical protein